MNSGSKVTVIGDLTVNEFLSGVQLASGMRITGSLTNSLWETYGKYVELGTGLLAKPKKRSWAVISKSGKKLKFHYKGHWWFGFKFGHPYTERLYPNRFNPDMSLPTIAGQAPHYVTPAGRMVKGKGPIAITKELVERHIKANLKRARSVIPTSRQAYNIDEYGKRSRINFNTRATYAFPWTQTFWKRFIKVELAFALVTVKSHTPVERVALHRRGKVAGALRNAWQKTEVRVNV